MSTNTTTELYGTPYVSPETSRGLTAGEINMLRTVFGDSINYDSVQVTANAIVINDTAISTDGNIRFDPSDYQDDFSQSSIQDKSWFVHEMTHVWQSQNGYEVFDNGLGLQGIMLGSDVNPYSYDLDPNKSFRDYNMEQQADIISDYYRYILSYDGTGGYSPQQNATLATLVGEFINSDKDASWLPTLEAQLEPWRDFVEELLKNIPLGGHINDSLDTIPDEFIAAVLDGLQLAFSGGILPYLFDLFPNDMNFDVNRFWELAQNWVPIGDPLALDLDGDGIETIGISTTSHVMFDSDGDGVKTAIGWIKGDDGLLVLDRNGNGTIDNGNELFGDQTVVNGAKATSGFNALSSEDTNGDGKFDTNDTNFANVRVWRDMDSDGVSDDGELFTLNELGIASINLSSSSESTTNNTNTITATSTFTKADGTTGTITNLNFTTNNFYSEFTDKIELDETGMSLLNINGSGMVRGVGESSMLSSDLSATVQNVQNQGYVSKEAFMSQVDTMLLEWANTSSMQTSVELANSILEKKLIYLAGGSIEDMRLYVYGYSDFTNSGTGTISTVDQATIDRYNYLHDEADRLAKLVEVLERFNGENFVNIQPEEEKVRGFGSTSVTDFSLAVGTNTSTTTSSGGVGHIVVEPPIFVSLSDEQIRSLEQSYKALKESVYNSIVLETRLKTYIDEIKLTLDENGFGLDMSGVVDMLNNGAITDLKNALIDWDDLMHFGKEKFDSIDVEAISELHDWMSELANNSLMLEQLIQYNGLELNAGIFHMGSNNDDVMNFNSTDDNFIVSSAGNDTISTGKGSDTVYSGSGDDTITIMNSLSNTIYAGDGNDNISTYYSTTLRNTVDGGLGNDTIKLGSGNDTIYGGAGNDIVNANDGDDIIIGGAGDDTLNGYNGNDTYMFSRGDGKDTIIDSGLGLDILNFIDGITTSDIVAKADGNNLVIALKEDGKTWDELSDKVTLKSWFTGADYRVETISFSDGTILTNNEIITQLLVTDSNDIIKTTEVTLTVDAKGGDDTITIMNSLSNTIYGGDGNDNISTYYSTTLRNTVDGGLGNDTIKLGSGNDTIYGGAGNDTITTGSGADVVVLNSLVGYDSVLDFSISQDKFQLDSTIFESLVDLQGVLSVDNISFGANTTVANDENDFIIYNQTNGNIFYDADGSGSVYAAILIADITNNLALNNTQFVVI